MKCVICKAELPEPSPHRPFCSERCKTLDLAKWLGEEYRISRELNYEERETYLNLVSEEAAQKIN